MPYTRKYRKRRTIRKRKRYRRSKRNLQQRQVLAGIRMKYTTVFTP